MAHSSDFGLDPATLSGAGGAAGAASSPFMHSPVLLESDCPYCGEVIDLHVDEGGGVDQVYVEDCPVCCRPWQVHVVQSASGDWQVTLRRSDD